MKRVKGITKNIEKNIIGKITYKNNVFIKNRILVSEKVPVIKFGIKALISTKNLNTTLPICKVDNINFNEHDIINISPDGVCNVLWENDSPHNALYVTDICNSHCIMCPQLENACSHYDDCEQVISCLSKKQLQYVGITGGEPTIEIDKLIALLNKIDGSIHILTNGKNFSEIENVKKISKIKNISFGIPLYSNISEEHDYIVGAVGSFEKTIQGLFNLAKYKQKIEIRIVILRQNYKNLSNIAEYIYRNLPFVTHIALMGLEYHGNAEKNYSSISIDPLEYKTELYNAVKNFVRRGFCVDVYNIPLCLVDSRIEEFCRDSISTWKKTYLPICEQCSKKDVCCGIFETSFVHSKNISPAYIN